MAKSEQDDTPASGLEISPSQLLHRTLQIALDFYAEEIGDANLTQRQFAVLAALSGQDGASQTALVKQTGIDRSTLADLVSRMMTKGLVERARALDDGRANTVTLTEAGRIALAEVEPAVQRADRRLLSLLSSSKREGFLAGMVRIIERSQDPEKFSARPEEGSPKRDKPQKKKKKKSGKTKKAPKISPAPAD